MGPPLTPYKQKANLPRMSETHFGFQTVPEEEKAGRVRDVFDRVASRYDLMNDAMSLGLHRLWKDRFVSRLRLYRDMDVLDVAGGTGDIAFRIARRMEELSPRITICDINAAMLEEGRKRAVDHNLHGRFDWLCADAESLPLPSASQDAYTVAFGIRNMTHIDQALREAFRVLKPGGQFLCLEFSDVPSDTLRRIYDAYSFHLVPRLGQWLAGEAQPYQYLVESIRRFPSATAFARMIGEAGFTQVSFERLNYGVVAIHRGWKP